MLWAAALAAGCGGGSSSTTSNGTCTPGQTADVGIASSGVSPKAVCVVPGGTVTFTNHDTVSHDIESSGPCPQLNLGPIAAGQAATATLPTAATCTFEDATRPSDDAFQGLVQVSTATTSGPGY